MTEDEGLAMITIIPLDVSPSSFKPWPKNPWTKKAKNSVLVVSRKNTPKVTMQIRMEFQAASGWHSEVVNVHLSGEEARKVANALMREAVAMA